MKTAPLIPPAGIVELERLETLVRNTLTRASDQLEDWEHAEISDPAPNRLFIAALVEMLRAETSSQIEKLAGALLVSIRRLDTVTAERDTIRAATTARVLAIVDAQLAELGTVGLYEIEPIVSGWINATQAIRDKIVTPDPPTQ